MPASRSSSRNSRVPCSVPITSDDYLQKTVTPGSRSVSRQPSIDGLSVKGRIGRQAAGVRRWGGDRGTPTEWDGLKRDPELWFPNGECLVHLYGRGRSRRGPSFRLTLDYLVSSELIMNYISQLGIDTQSSTTSGSGSEDDGFASPVGTDEYGLYIPAPTSLSPVDAFRYHLTTRNMFACMYGKPIVGFRLGQALLDLLERMNELNPSVNDNLSVVLAYMDHVGYLDFRECPDHALAALNFAERFEFDGLWTDAFVHCAGMNDRLTETAEFESTSYGTRALIMRTRLDMEIRYEHAERSMSNFLEDDFVTICHGLKNDVRVHLDRFRSFLNSYYVGKYGYWPPGQFGSSSAAYSKSTLRSMYFEFRNLYEYLLDQDSSPAAQDQEREDGGSVTYSDREQSYTTLKLAKLRASFGCKKAKTEKRLAMMTALAAATNHEILTEMRCPLVQEYMRFEDACAWERDGKISAADGRKIRWILIYAILQILISVNQAPKEVRDTDGVSYPLCITMPGSFPWETMEKLQPRSEGRTEAQMDKEPDHKVYSLQPSSLVSAKKPGKNAPPVARKQNAKDLTSITSVQPLRLKSSGILRQGDVNRLDPADVDSDSNSSRLSPAGSGWSDRSAPSSDDGLPSVESLDINDCVRGSDKHEEIRSRRELSTGGVLK